MAPEYLACLEEHPSDPSPATLPRLADALGTRLVEPRGGDQDLPPGQGHALLHPRLRELSQEEYRTLLPTHGVGAFL
ncbi:hypothetical protein GCM10023097_17730 [Streptomyces collinus]|uniref:Uncharacterized protein n=1 Tax=Streptomyces collinus TaxID=42684 RepID=A0AA89QBA7_STRCU|nr:hypothetical protein [Streptomyces collinus]